MSISVKRYGLQIHCTMNLVIHFRFNRKMPERFRIAPMPLCWHSFYAYEDDRRGISGRGLAVVGALLV